MLNILFKNIFKILFVSFQFSHPYFNTKCVQLQQCLSLISDQRSKLRVTKFCEYKAPLRQALVCCTVEDYEKSRDILRATRSKVRIDAIKKEDEYFHLKNCLTRDQEFRHFARKLSELSV